MYQDWLSRTGFEFGFKAEVGDAASSAIQLVSPQAIRRAGVSHVRYPVQSLIYGHVSENVEEARRRGRSLSRAISNGWIGTVSRYGKSGSWKDELPEAMALPRRWLSRSWKMRP